MNILIATLIAAAGSLVVTYAWYNALTLAWLSDTLWTAFNGLLGGAHPGYASDLEFVTVLGGSAGILFVTSLVTIRKLRKR